MANPRGRPTKPPEERKNAHVIVRVDEADRVEFDEAAKNADLRLSDWIRDRLKAAAIREKKRAASPH